MTFLYNTPNYYREDRCHKRKRVMNRKLLKILIILSLVVSIFLSGFVYKDAFFAYFFQDDWFTLRIGNAKNIADFFSFFIPRSDVIYYRPLGMQIPFFLVQTFFGINPAAFHLLAFVTHAANIILVFLLFYLLRKDLFIGLLGAFMYGVSSVHYIPAFWSATYAFVLGPTFFFLSFILFLLSGQRKKNIYRVSSLISFIVGLLVNEMVAVLILILLSYQLFIKKFAWKKLIPYFYALIAILLLRFIIFIPPVDGSYQIGLGRQILNNFRGYLLWSFNWPEEMKAQFVNFWQINPIFIREFSGYFWIFIISFFVNIFLMFIIPLSLGILQKKLNFINLFIFSTVWFVAGLLPVLFFTKHSFSYYLPISLVGLLFLSSVLFRYLLGKIYIRNKILALIILLTFVTNWTISSAVTLDFNSKIHWAPRRAGISKTLIDKAKKLYPPAELKSDYIYVRPSSENKLSLNNQDAFKVIYNNDNLITIYRYVFRKIIL